VKTEMRSLLFLCFLSVSVVLGNLQHQVDPTDTSSLTQPLIVDPNALSAAAAQNVANIAQILADAPASADDPPPAANQDDLANMLDAGSGTGSTSTTSSSTDTSSTDSSSDSSDSSDDSSSSDSSSSSADQTSAIEKEIKLLTSLVDHGKAIAAALPDKEQRLKELAAQLAAASSKQKAQGAQAQLAEQKLLLAQIQLKIAALKQKLEDLETTQTKLQASIDKVSGAVDANDQVTHQLNQEAAQASVGGTTSTGGAAPAAAASFLDSQSVEAVTRQAKQVLGRAFAQRFKDLIR